MTSLQIIISAVLSLAVLAGIAMMSRVKTAVAGNLLSALALLVGVVVTLCWNVETMTLPTLLPAIAVGGLAGGWMAVRVKMIQMPQTVALFNGLGGGASALVGILTAANADAGADYALFVRFTAMLAIAVGTITLVGSLVAAGKLHRVLNQRPVVLPSHSVLTVVWLVLTVAAAVMVLLLPGMHAVGQPPILGIAAFSLFMALLNASIKPVVQTLALPFTILSFGFLALVINWLFMELASWLSLSLFDVGVTIDGFWWAVLGSIIMSIVSGIVSAAIGS